jgi:AraC-like DNA-binding protein
MEGRFIRYIQLALVASGRLSKAVAELRAKRRFLLARGTPEPTVADTGVSSRTLLTWYERKFGRIRTTVDEHAVNLGFSSAEHFRSELAAQYLFERRPRKRAKEGPEKNF